MIVKEEFLNKLRQFFGLNLYEVRIWTALLSRGVSTAGELSDIGNVPRSRAYDILESLEKKGFVVVGTSPDGKLVEVVELKNHPFFVGTQFHPELKSRPLAPHPLFMGFVKAASLSQ